MSDYHSHDSLRSIFGGFLDLFSCRKTATKSSGISWYIFVKENGYKSSPWHHVLSNQATSDQLAMEAFIAPATSV
jgi:hypothetical protein